MRFGVSPYFAVRIYREACPPRAKNGFHLLFTCYFHLLLQFLPSRLVRIRLRTPPPSLPEPRKPSSIEKGPFRRGSCRLFSTFPGLCRHDGLSGGFFGSGLCIQKFRSWRLDFEARRRPGIGCRKVSFARLRKPIADLIRGFRTVGSIPPERRGAARHRCREANDLRPRL